jgi:hypothetical protein
MRGTQADLPHAVPRQLRLAANATVVATATGAGCDVRMYLLVNTTQG